MESHCSTRARPEKTDGQSREFETHAGKLFRATHNTLALVAYATIVLHVAAALKHQFFDRDDILARMIPLLRSKAGVS